MSFNPKARFWQMPWFYPVNEPPASVMTNFLDAQAGVEIHISDKAFNNGDGKVRVFYNGTLVSQSDYTTKALFAAVNRMQRLRKGEQ